MTYLNLTDEKIITVLLSAGYSPSFTEFYSINQISMKSLVSYADTHKSIKKLEKTGVVKIKQLSNRHVVTYNYDETVIGAYVEGLKAKLFMISWLEIQHFINTLEKEIDSVSYSIIIFGSYAKNEQNVKSDIDILFLSEKQQLDEIQKKFKSARKYTTKAYDAHFFTYKEFTEMLKEAPKMNIATETYKNHVILSGAENYMKCLKKVQNENQ